MSGHSASSSGSVADEELKNEASNLAEPFWRTVSKLSSEEKTLWIQSGLAVSPLMGTCLQYFLDFCLAWTLIGEWTSRSSFLSPKGADLDRGMRGVLQNYQCRTPRIVACTSSLWTRCPFIPANDAGSCTGP